MRKMKEKTILVDTEDPNFRWMRSRLTASVNVIKLRTTEAYSNLNLTDVKYSTSEQSGEENLQVMERIRPNSFKHL
jgi:hypothetical protein